MTDATISPFEIVQDAVRRLRQEARGAFVPLLVGSVLIGLGGWLVGAARGALTDRLLWMGAERAQLLTAVPGVLLQSVPTAYFGAKLARVALAANRGEPVGFSLSPDPAFARMYVATVAQQLLIMVGTALCIAPGLIAAVGLSVFSFALIDEQLSSVEALARSWELTQGKKIHVFLLMLVLAILVVLGLLACVVGVAFVGPIVWMSGANLYLRLKGDEPAIVK